MQKERTLDPQTTLNLADLAPWLMVSCRSQPSEHKPDPQPSTDIVSHAPWVTVGCRERWLVFPRSLLKNTKYNVRPSRNKNYYSLELTFIKHSLFFQDFITMLKGAYGKHPDFNDVVEQPPYKHYDIDPRKWISGASLDLKLTLRDAGSGGGVHEVVALYAEGWEALIDYIVTIEVQIMKKS